MRRFLKLKMLFSILLFAAPASAQAVVPAYSSAKVEALAQAIGHAEGFYVRGSKPARKRNPGDLKQAGVYRVFRTDAAGWEALRAQLLRVVAGQSRQYRLDMTIEQMGRRYAGSPLWANNVARYLHVSTSTKLEAILCEGWLDVPPKVYFSGPAETCIPLVECLDSKAAATYRLQPSPDVQRPLPIFGANIRVNIRPRLALIKKAAAGRKLQINRCVQQPYTFSGPESTWKPYAVCPDWAAMQVLKTSSSVWPITLEGQ